MNKKENVKTMLNILRTGDEKKLRELKMPWPKTDKELAQIVAALSKRQHDYGTCVYAMSLAAEAAFNLMAHKLGVTGFQASCADMDIIRRTRHMERFAIQNYENLLYPQYLSEEHFPGPDTLISKNAKWLSEEAKKNLATRGPVHPNVKAHWERLAALG